MVKRIIGESAEGVEGCIIGSSGIKYFRVYNDDHTFTDYRILHSDLFVNIADSDATFYSDEEGNHYIDHCPETLGIEDEA